MSYFFQFQFASLLLATWLFLYTAMDTLYECMLWSQKVKVTFWFIQYLQNIVKFQFSCPKILSYFKLENKALSMEINNFCCNDMSAGTREILLASKKYIGKLVFYCKHYNDILLLILICLGYLQWISNIDGYMLSEKLSVEICYRKRIPASS